MLFLFIFIELMTSASRNCAEAICSAGTVPVLVKLIHQTNRNAASLSVVKTILQIFLNLCRVSIIIGELYSGISLIWASCNWNHK